MQTPMELEQFISTPLEATSPKYRSDNKRKPNTREYLIYSLETLSELLMEMRGNKEIPVLRYLVDIGGRLWFARETQAGGPAAPAHYQMTGEDSNGAFCKAAGNIRLDENYQALININHKSGDFRPSFISLQWLFAILLKKEALPFSLPENLAIEELDSNGAPIKENLWPTKMLKEWAEQITDPNLLTKITNQPKKTKMVSYTGPQFTLPKSDTPAVAWMPLPRRLSFLSNLHPTAPAAASSGEPFAKQVRVSLFN
jgi:hypothetical protein